MTRWRWRRTRDEGEGETVWVGTSPVGTLHHIRLLDGEESFRAQVGGDGVVTRRFSTLEAAKAHVKRRIS